LSKLRPRTRPTAAIITPEYFITGLKAHFSLHNTGKELIARALHTLSAGNARPLVKVNCAALPANLIKSELFGHEKGSRFHPE
jgi:hypothetical protein